MPTVIPTSQLNPKPKFRVRFQTYSTQQDWYSSQNSQHENHREDHRTTLRIWLEDMVDLLSLSISQWLLINRDGGVRIHFDFEVEDVVAERLGGAEGCEEESCAERGSCG